MISYRWLRGTDPSRKAHAVIWHEFHQATLCGAIGLGEPEPAGKTPRCKRCVAMAKRLKVRMA